MSSYPNLLTDKLPCEIRVGEKSYPLKTDFRVWINFETTFCDEEISKEDKFVEICKTCFDLEKKKELPENYKAAMNALMRFYGGHSYKTDFGGTKAVKKPVYDFAVDSGLIVAAFRECYGIDLRNVEYMHWYEFVSLFKGLSPECKFLKIVGLRDADLSKLRGEERNFCQAAKKAYAIPDRRTEKQKDDAVALSLWEAF